MDELTQKAVKAVKKSQIAYSKFITANDVGSTGAHQAGYHLHKSTHKLIFDKPGERGTNLEKFVTIKWQDDFETQSRFIYYGQGTRDEYRLTRFGRGFPFLGDDDIGSLLVICKVADEHYSAFVLRTDEQIEDFLGSFNLSPANANGLIRDLEQVSPGIEAEFAKYIATLETGFPATEELAKNARLIFNSFYRHSDKKAVENPDTELIGWIDTEYDLFKTLEKKIYKSTMSSKFDDVEQLIKVSNTILNRRKSRAGKSLEHHLAAIFDINHIPYSWGKVTEGNRKPDFIMPSIISYHNQGYPSGRLIFLGAKTTCKDRWRQVLNEAARIPKKHLFTLQPGISSNQLKEMKGENLTLVVPEQNISTFPPQHRGELLSLKTFIGFSKDLLGV